MYINIVIILDLPAELSHEMKQFFFDTTSRKVARAILINLFFQMRLLPLKSSRLSKDANQLVTTLVLIYLHVCRLGYCLNACRLTLSE